MKNIIKQYPKTTVIIILVTIPLLWYFTPYPRGIIMAKIDLFFGHKEIQTFGYPAASRREYSKILKEKYDVNLREVAGCVVTNSLFSYVKGYNSFSKEGIIQLYKKDIFEECSKEADKRLDEKKLKRLEQKSEAD